MQGRRGRALQGAGAGSVSAGLSVADSGFLDGLPADMAARAAAILERGMTGMARPRRAYRGDPDFEDILQEADGNSAFEADSGIADSLGTGSAASGSVSAAAFDGDADGEAPRPARGARGMSKAEQDEEYAPSLGEGQPAVRNPASLGFCRHRVFGRGKIVQFLPPDKYRVNFPGLGLKVIMGAYLTMED